MKYFSPLLNVIVACAGMATGASAAESSTVLLQAEGKVIRANCSGNDAKIEGNHNTVTLAGSCQGLRLYGVANHVIIDLRNGAPVRIEGSANLVSYRVKDDPPSVVTLGLNNAVRPDNLTRAVEVSLPPPPRELPPREPMAAPLPAATAGTLDLAGSDEQRIADCKGRDVRIHGMRSAYVLRGGCRSVVVEGNLMTVQAEIVPGARIAIEGSGTVVAWANVAGGSWRDQPQQSVNGFDSRVQRADMIGGQLVR